MQLLQERKVRAGNYVGVAKAIKDIRAALGLNQKEFAVKLRVSMQSVFYWEKGVNLPNKTNVRRIVHLAREIR